MNELELWGADFFYSGMGLPQEDAGMIVSGSTLGATVVTTGKLEELRRMYPHALEKPTVNVIAPVPANAHTHLDMSTIPFKQGSYTPWIGYVVQNREQRTLESAKVGLELLGQVIPSARPIFGDIVFNPEVMRFLLTQVEAQGVAYWEVFAPDPADASRVFNETVTQMREFKALERPEKIRLGLSPHTAHTVSSELLRRLVHWAKAEGFPLQIHLGESPAEWELFQSGTGPLAHMMERITGATLTEILGVEPSSELTPVGQLARLGVLEARPTLIHMVHVSETDVQQIARAGCVVVTCPRSNAALSCGRFDWSLFARYGIEIGLGTDSVASGESLNILDELEFAKNLYGDGLSMRSLVRAAVKGSYRALGLEVPRVRRGEAVGNVRVWEQ